MMLTGPAEIVCVGETFQADRREVEREVEAL
jgi:hypothetical protein